MTKNNNLNKKCRTCLKGSNGFQLLTKTIIDQKEETKCFADFLKDITGIDIMNETFDGMPQYICCYCIRKVKASYGFVQQVKQVHKQLWTMLKDVSNNIDENKTRNCLEEVQIDIKNCMEIKLEEEEASSISVNKLVVLKAETMKKDNIIVGGTANNLREEDVEDNFVQNAAPEPITVEQYEPMSECEGDDGTLSDTNFIKPETSTNSDDDDDDSKSSNDPDWFKPKDIDDNTQTSCDQCNKVFPNYRLLRCHKTRTHVPEALKVQCPYCPAKYGRRYDMYFHMRLHHKDKPVEEHLKVKRKKLPRKYSCEQCDRVFTSNYHLMGHIKVKHNPQTIPKKSKLVLCSLCGSFELQSNLKEHIRRHTKEKPFKCDLCDKTFYRFCDVQAHRRSHTGEKPFICKICEKGFAKSAKLKVHMRAHSNERPYKCDQCEKAFKDSKNLKIHKRLHTGERPYTCSVCHSGFIKSTALKYHQTKTQHFEKNYQIVS